MDNASSGTEEKRKVSPNLNAEDADLLLISKDNVVFRTHRLYLEANSPIFKDMFALGSNEKELPEVQPDESTAALEVALPYIPKAGRAVCAELY